MKDYWAESVLHTVAQPVITYSKLSIETLQQGVKVDKIDICFNNYITIVIYITNM